MDIQLQFAHPDVWDEESLTTLKAIELENRHEDGNHTPLGDITQVSDGEWPNLEGVVVDWYEDDSIEEVVL